MSFWKSTTKISRHIRSLNMQKDLSDWIDVSKIEIDDNVSREINKSINQG